MPGRRGRAICRLASLIADMTEQSPEPMPGSPAAADLTIKQGRIAAVHGSVVDIAFAAGALPAIAEAVAIDWDQGPPLIAEVEQHLGPVLVRAVALAGTAGLRRGIGVRALGAPRSEERRVGTVWRCACA